MKNPFAQTLRNLESNEPMQSERPERLPSTSETFSGASSPVDGPQPLPRKRGRPFGSKNRPKMIPTTVEETKQTIEEVSESASNGLFGKPERELPEDPAELDRKLAPYRLMARPIVTGVSAAFKLGKMPALDKDETEGGVMAFSAFLYQFGAEIDARLLLLLWSASVTGPRLMALALDKEQLNTVRIGIEREKRHEADTPIRVVEGSKA